MSHGSRVREKKKTDLGPGDVHAGGGDVGGGRAVPFWCLAWSR